MPAKDESASLPVLYSELMAVIKKIHQPYEILFINDGSTDNSGKIMDSLAKKNHNVHVIHFRANFGKSAALSRGFEKAKGSTLITLDADLQDDPVDIPKFLSLMSKGYDLVVGRRQKRRDLLSKKLSSLLFNTLTRIITGVDLHDVNCGLKVFKKEVARDIKLHGELHRFIPILAAKHKYVVTELPVHHRPRKFGKSKFGFERSWRGLVDLLTTVFLTDYLGKPAHFFGKIGLLLSTIGFFLTGYVTYIRITTGSTGHHIPLLLGGILLLMLGVQLISTGLIAEMITYYNRGDTSFE